MIWKKQWRAFLIIATLFLMSYYLPIEGLRTSTRWVNALLAALHLMRWYAREHVLLCLVPAFFIAGAIGVFVSQASVMKYLGARANKALAYGVASVSGTILAVCSCTVLPLFAGIYKRGAGLGPATAFLYSGPAINVLAIVLTMRVLGLELGIARAVGAIIFSIVIGLLMHLFFRNEEIENAKAKAFATEPEVSRPLWKTALYFGSMVAVLVFANWGHPRLEQGLWHYIYTAKWILAGIFSISLAVMLVAWFGAKWQHMIMAGLPALVIAIVLPQHPSLAFTAGVIGLSVLSMRHGGELGEWLDSSWGFARQIMPLLAIGILVAGVLLGLPEHEGLIPPGWIARAVGGNSIMANLFASVAGAFMYFATLTEVPILQGLIGAGMGKGPALALLLAGPALSLPNMLVIRSVIGTKKTVVFVLLVVVMATITGLIYGAFF